MLAMRMLTFLLFTSFLAVHATSVSQTVSYSGNAINLKQVFNAIKKQTGYVTLSRDGELIFKSTISVDAHNVPLEVFLNLILETLPLEYTIKGKTIFLSKKLNARVQEQKDLNFVPLPMADSLKRISGQILTEENEPIFGASVMVKGSRRGATTDKSGKFIIEATAGQTIMVTYVGYENYSFKVKSDEPVLIKMMVSSAAMEEMVVTGIYQREKESFSGSSTTYTASELKTVGNQNILQSLKTLDPSFAIIENNLFGSDPNRMPDIEIRGKSSVIGLTDEYSNNPNRPLFILDGFETTLNVISDFSMDRIESITLLKDAAATAIYGSRAANGVVVVETKRPVPGQLRLNYNLNTSFSFADLSDYNLMNAAEKLEYEKLSGFYGSLDANGNITSEDGDSKYFNRLKEVKRGVDTYWPNEPLRFAPTQRHTLIVEGGDEHLRYSASLSYGNTKGVMKESSREVTSGNVRLIYRRGRLSFNNSLSIDYVKANRETISFSRFARANPYHRKFNEQGGIDKVMESFQYLDIATFSIKAMNVYNPLYDFNNNNLNQSESQSFTNNFEMDWRIIDELRVRARLGIGRLADKSTIFQSPFNSDFIGTDALKQGSYDETNDHQTNVNGDLSFTYGKLLGNKHMVNAVTGVTLNNNAATISGYQVVGFVDDDFTNPTFAFGYADNKRAIFRQSQSRSASFFLNTGYAYNDRLLVDATLRSDGSSIYGSNKQFTTIWSLGAGWNIHNEQFMSGIDMSWVSFFKVRASIGNPGNQNFSDYISMRVYRYNNEDRNPFGSSVILNNFGNNSLQWQKTLDRNIGLDLELFDKRFRINADYFNKNTDPLLVIIAMPSSTGTTTQAQNLGEQNTKGFTIITDYTILRKREFTWRVNINMRQLKSEYKNIDKALDKYNEQNKSRNLLRYYDGGSPSDLWAVPSLGIDAATGREIFLNKNGHQTFVHNYDDERIVGNSEPDLDGIIGTSVFHKGFSASINLRYRLGGQVFMQTLYEKVENITIANITLNQDKRALYDRWKKPGDNAKFKAISQTAVTPISSRFVEDNNIFAGESISIGYENTTNPWLGKIGASSVSFRAYMNDIFRFSSVQNERGIDYPFARSFSFSLGLRF